MGWFWADNNITDEPANAVANNNTLHNGSVSKCPVDHTKLKSWGFTRNSSNEAKSVGNNGGEEEKKPAASGGCPVDHTKRSKWLARGPDRNNNAVNPLNNMPDLSSQKAPGQTIDLPTTRTQSSIPKGVTEQEGVWEYPSPQQMLNAMLRKGGEVPEDAVESMVDVHNFLNEGAWFEILKWEQPYTEESKVSPRLLQFTGRPNDMTPRARYYQLLHTLFPSRYGDPPFDRHDWYVLRHKASKSADETGPDAWDKVRYVIDYYAGPDDAHGMPTFFLDVRPALDDFTSLKDRTSKAAQNLWDRAMRGDA